MLIELICVCEHRGNEDGGLSMTVIVCLDNANGMMSNHRRQSRDANVVKDILKTINGASVGLQYILDN